MWYAQNEAKEDLSLSPRGGSWRLWVARLWAESVSKETDIPSSWAIGRPGVTQLGTYKEKLSMNTSVYKAQTHNPKEAPVPRDASWGRKEGTQVGRWSVSAGPSKFCHWRERLEDLTLFSVSH